MAATGHESVLKQCCPLVYDRSYTEVHVEARVGDIFLLYTSDSAAFLTQSHFSYIQAVWLHLHTFIS